MRVMGEVPPSHDAVRAYLDSAVAEAAERWVGRAADATAYADLVAAVLARREALSTLRHLAERPHADPPPVRPAALAPLPSGSSARPRHTERRARPRWPLGGGAPVGSIADRADPALAPAAATPASGPSLDIRGGATLTGHSGSAAQSGPIGLPTRPPGRHRTPPPEPSGAPDAINLNQNLSTVLDWLGRPES
jgi:hypothetical protein